VKARAGLDVCKNLDRTGIRSPDHLALNESLNRLSYPGMTKLTSLRNFAEVPLK
jgi:hypothetical protein